MKKLFLICIGLLLFAGKGVAQTSSVELSNKELKERMAVNAPLLYNKYKSASTLKSVGMGLTFGGIGLGIIGMIAADKETTSDGVTTTVNLSGPGAVIFGVGIVSAIAGVPIWIVGGTKRKKTRNAYLKEFGYSMPTPTQPVPYVQLNSSANGLGLALVF